LIVLIFAEDYELLRSSLCDFNTSLIRKKSDTTQKVPFFRRSNWIFFFSSSIQNWRIRNCKYVSKKGILYTWFTSR
jgi:hypothetical protein